MRSLLRHGMEVVAERRSKLALGEVREVDYENFTATVAIPGVAHGGERELRMVALPTWVPGKPHVRVGDPVLVAIPSAAAGLAHIICTVSTEAPGLTTVQNVSSGSKVPAGATPPESGGSVSVDGVSTESAVADGAAERSQQRGGIRGLVQRLKDTVAAFRVWLGAEKKPVPQGGSKRVSATESNFQHPQGRHGLYVRDGGIVDLQTVGAVLGIRPEGWTVEAPAGYIGVSDLVVRSGRISMQLPADGYYLSGRQLHPALVSGREVATPLWDAEVLVSPESLKAMESAGAVGKAKPPRTRPVVVGNTPMAAVRLGDLFRWLPFTAKPDSDLFDWTGQVIRELQRGVSGAIGSASGG